jgi:hypothetical protein
VLAHIGVQRLIVQKRRKHHQQQQQTTTTTTSIDKKTLKKNGNTGKINKNKATNIENKTWVFK